MPTDELAYEGMCYYSMYMYVSLLPISVRSRGEADVSMLMLMIVHCVFALCHATQLPNPAVLSTQLYSTLSAPSPASRSTVP
jgi:hypothetical protein